MIFRLYKPVELKKAAMIFVSDKAAAKANKNFAITPKLKQKETFLLTKA